MKPLKPAVHESPKTVIRTSSENVILPNLLVFFPLLFLSLFTLLVAVILYHYCLYVTHIINVLSGGTGLSDQRTKSLTLDNRMIPLFSQPCHHLIISEREKNSYCKIDRNKTPASILKIKLVLKKLLNSHVCFSFIKFGESGLQVRRDTTSASRVRSANFTFPLHQRIAPPLCHWC